MSNIPYPPLAPEAYPNVDHLVTEDDTPVDNIFSEKQQRLLTEPLYSSWQGPGEGRPFMALANVGLYSALKRPPLVPDAMLSLDVRPADDVWKKENRSYLIWIFGKPPEVVVEIVSNREGGEADVKALEYARMGIPFYVIFDPEQQLGGDVLRVFGLNQGKYQSISPDWFPGVGLGLTLWHGIFEDKEALWLRWRDQNGSLILTGAEGSAAAQQRAAEERLRADQERLRADEESHRAKEAEERANRLADQLRAAGLDPSS